MDAKDEFKDFVAGEYGKTIAEEVDGEIASRVTTLAPSDFYARAMQILSQVLNRHHQLRPYAGPTESTTDIERLV